MTNRDQFWKGVEAGVVKSAGARWRAVKGLASIAKRFGQTHSGKLDGLRQSRDALGMPPELPRMDSKTFGGLADWIGTQDWGPGFPKMELYNLRRPLGRHPKGSTLDRGTIAGLLDPDLRAKRSRSVL